MSNNTVRFDIGFIVNGKKVWCNGHGIVTLSSIITTVKELMQISDIAYAHKMKWENQEGDNEE